MPAKEHFDNQGVLQKIFKTEDITGHIENKQLKESEDTFRVLAEQLPNMIFINVNGRLVFVNHKCEKIMGYTRKEFCSPDFNFLTLVAPEYQELTRRNWKKHSAGRDVGSYEYVIMTKHGKRIAAVITTKLIQYHNQQGILGIITDISKMKGVEEDLKTLTQQLSEQKKELQRKNVALREVLEQIEAEKFQLKRQMAVNTDRLILPALAQLKNRIRPADRGYVALIEAKVKDMASKFGLELAHSPTRLSVRETEVCGMIRSGLSTKEIADMLHITLRTVTTHREHIRRKLQLTSRSINLSSHLRTIG